MWPGQISIYGQIIRLSGWKRSGRHLRESGSAFDDSESGYDKGTIRDDARYRSVSTDVRRHRLISVSYISLLPCHGKGRSFCSGSSSVFSCALISIRGHRLRPHLETEDFALFLIESHDTQRSPCVPAHKVAAISAAWSRTSWGRTIASGGVPDEPLDSLTDGMG